jgi:pimeloyl-ACP methyl ester carboxylesterase
MTTTVFIHGAGASSASFNYMQDRCPWDHVVLIEYSIQQTFEHNLSEMQSTVDSVDGPLFFVAHSLGGLFALQLASTRPQRTQGGVTISTPYGGSELASMMRVFSTVPHFFADIDPMGSVIRRGLTTPAPRNWINLVSTAGTSFWSREPNDGVVSLASQRAHPEIATVDMPINHHEILLFEPAIDLVWSQFQQSRP